MAQNDILDYIRQTPHNSNVNVVKGMLNGAGGGNPNHIETIQGTLANPFGEIELKWLADEIESNNATAFLHVQFTYTPQEGNPTDYDFSGFIKPNSPFIFFESCSIFRTDLNGVMYVIWFDTGRLECAAIEDINYVPLTTIADQIETELTICWHPLPISSTDK